MPYELILGIRIALLAIMTLAAAIVIFTVLKQPGNSDGSSAITGASSTDTFYGKNKSKRLEAKWKSWTVVCAIVLAASSIAFFLLGIL